VPMTRKHTPPTGDGALEESQARPFPQPRSDDQRLRERDAIVRAMLETALDAIIMMDHQGRVVEFNPAAERTFGYSRAAALGCEMAALIIPPAWRDQHRAGLANYLATGEGPVLGQRIEVTALRADGSLFPAELAITRIPLDGPPVFTGHIRDITERKRSEEAVRANEERFRALSEHASDLVSILDAGGAYRYASPSHQRVLGYAPADVQGRNVFTLIHPDDLPRVLEVFERGSRVEGTVETVELRMRHADGSWRELEVVGITRFADPAVGGVIVNAHDVTERKRAEAALRASEERLRTVVTNAPIVLFAVDRDGVFTLSDGQGLAALGLRPGQHVGQSYFALYGDLADSVAVMRRVLAGEEATTVNRFKGLVFETRWTPLRDESGALTGAIGVSADITERTRAEAERGRMERRTQEALEALLSMAQAVVDVRDDDDEERPERVAAPLVEARAVGQRLVELARRVLGCQRASIIAIDPSTGLRQPIASAGLSPRHEQLWRTSVEGAPSDDPGASPDPALIARLRAGEVVILDLAQPLWRDRLNRFSAYTILIAPMRVGSDLVGVLSLDDENAARVYSAGDLALAEAVAQLAAVTIERARLLRERAEARASALALREANRRMDEFLSIAGHEMRTPLTTIKGNIQLARRRLTHELARADAPGDGAGRGLAGTARLLERSDTQLNRLNRLVDDLLDVSRIQAGRLELRLERHDLAGLVREIVEESRQAHAGRVIDAYALEGDALPLDIDADRIAQVVVNYLTNALKYAPPERPIAVGVEADGPVARVWVRDEGPGLPADERERVWDRFYQVAGIAHQEGSSVGLGLGLHISRTIITAHGGQAGVESAPGQGATFWFTLPLAARDESHRREIAP